MKFDISDGVNISRMLEYLLVLFGEEKILYLMLASFFVLLHWVELFFGELPVRLMTRCGFTHLFNTVISVASTFQRKAATLYEVITLFRDAPLHCPLSCVWRS